MKIQIYHSHYKSSSDFKSCIEALGADINKAASAGYSVYYCPSDFLGIDMLGESVLARSEDKYRQSFDYLVSPEIKADGMLVLLGFRNTEGAVSAAAIKDGKIIFISKLSKPLNLLCGDIKLTFADIAGEGTFSLSSADVVFFFGSLKYEPDIYSCTENMLRSLSKNNVCAIFYRSAFNPVCRDFDVFLEKTFEINYFEISQENIVDIGLIEYQKRIKKISISDNFADMISVAPLKECGEIAFPRLPLVEMEDKRELEKSFDCAALAVADRMRRTGTEKLVFGLSGGVDSAATLLIAVRAVDYLKIDRKNVIAVSMPGQGTGKRTHSNSRKLAEKTGITFMEIPISESVKMHFKDIGHDESVKDKTYENAQARERMQILFDLANKYSALELGTGDLSEAAVGWCTYGGDQAAMFNTNLSFSKTQLQFILKNAAKKYSLDVLDDILSTPISPELLPPDEMGNILQKSEDTLGPYEVTDFVIYLYLYRGYEIPECENAALKTFSSVYSKADIVKWVNSFERLFYRSAFKRNTAAPSPYVTKIGQVFSGFDIAGTS